MAKDKKEKTNALRLLEANKIEHHIYSYDVPEGFLDGVSAAEKIGVPVERVFKTLVTQSKVGEYYVCIIPSHQELDFKKAAKHFGVKKIEMIPSKEITKVTGYIKGGCSPLGMKKAYPTAVDASASELSSFVVSAGKVGLHMEMAPDALLELIRGSLADLVI